MSATPSPQLLAFCASWLQRPVLPEVRQVADVITQRHAHVEAVLAYGSCLRGTDVADTLIDYYVLTRDLAGVSRNWLSRWGCALVPPNVYYIEHTVGGRRLRAKYAVLPLSAFATWMSLETANPYFWARFAQPSALVLSASDESERNVIKAVATALMTCFANARGLSASADPLIIWTDGFRATYGTELRSERADRADNIVSANDDYYREAAALLAAVPPHTANWKWRRYAGKLMAVLRLIKASFTFQGGADYLAWKIERHSGVAITLTEWQRRHPLLAGPLLLWQLKRKGAIR